jgi:hypothetical protein
LKHWQLLVIVSVSVFCGSNKCTNCCIREKPWGHCCSALISMQASLWHAMKQRRSSFRECVCTKHCCGSVLAVFKCWDCCSSVLACWLGRGILVAALGTPTLRLANLAGPSLAVVGVVSRQFHACEECSCSELVEVSS